MIISSRGQKSKRCSFTVKMDYYEIFRRSKCLITDCGSFLLEYFSTGKPLIHMRSLRNKNKPWKFNQKIFDTFYVVYEQEGLLKNLDDILLNGKDPKKMQRWKTLVNTKFGLSNCARTIVSDLLSEIL